MGLHKPFDRHFFTLGGSVMKTGYSLNLTKGVIGLFDLKKTSKDGMEAVTSFAGHSKDREYVFRMGMGDRPVSRSQDNKNASSYPFKLSDVISVKASAPESTEQSVDEVSIGYNGVDADTAITFKIGDRKTIYLKLCGEQVGLLGYPNNTVEIEYTMEADKCDPYESCFDCDDCLDVNCQPLVQGYVDFLNSYELKGGVALTELIEVNPVKSCATEETFALTPYDFYCMSVCDTGDQNALALVQAQYPDFKIIKKDRVGSTTTYEFIALQGTTVADYKQSIASVLKGCEDCPAGYTEVVGGVIYALALEDEGADLVATAEGLPGAVAGTGKKNGQDFGVGYYTVVLDNALTQVEIDAFVLANPTATIDLVGDVATICENATVTTVAWAVCGTCNASEEEYKITLPDDCNGERLAELQAAYPNLVVTYDSVNSTNTVSVTGTLGTANITIGGVDYLATFNTDLATTATDFVTTHASAILTATGAVLTSTGDILTVEGVTAELPTLTVTNLTGDLDGTIGVAAIVPITGGCTTKYKTTVKTNLVCEECDPIYLAAFSSEAPSDFEANKWAKVVNETAYTSCLCGVKFKGKVFEINPDECLRGELNFTEDSVQIEVSGGYITEQREGVGRIMDEPMNVMYFSRWTPRTHVGGNMWEFEEESRWHLDNESRSDSLLTRILKGQQSNIGASSQVVDYSIQLRRSGYTQSMSQTNFNSAIELHIIAEYGRHKDVEALVNLIAGGAGVSGVSV